MHQVGETQENTLHTKTIHRKTKDPKTPQNITTILEARSTKKNPQIYRDRNLKCSQKGEIEQAQSIGKGIYYIQLSHLRKLLYLEKISQRTVYFTEFERYWKNYLVFSLGGMRLFNMQSRIHKGKSFSSSVPSRSVIFFLHGPL